MGHAYSLVYSLLIEDWSVFHQIEERLECEIDAGAKSLGKI